MDTLLDLAGLGETAPPSVRRPTVSIGFGPPAEAGGGLGGLLGGTGDAGGAVAGAVSALGVEVGGGADAWQRSIVSVVVEVGLAPFVDVADVVLATNPEAPVVGVGSEGAISFGYADTEPVLQFTGTVDSVRRSLGGMLRFSATNGGAALARLRLAQSYEQQSAGAIVSDVVQRVGMALGTVENGIDFPFLVLDDRQGAYAHLAALARRAGSGFAASIAPDGKLRFGPIGGDDPVRTFTCGVDLIDLTVTATTPRAGRITTAGEGAAGRHGQDAWSWLIKDPAPVQGTSGAGDPSRLVQDPALRSVDAVRAAAAGLAATTDAQTLVGEALTLGEPAAGPGATIEITAAPHEEMNGRFLVHRVRHTYARQSGFTSRLVFTRIGNAGPAGGDLLGTLGSVL